jgi:hypothetical protein
VDREGYETVISSPAVWVLTKRLNSIMHAIACCGSKTYTFIGFAQLRLFDLRPTPAPISKNFKSGFRKISKVMNSVLASPDVGKDEE